MALRLLAGPFGNLAADFAKFLYRGIFEPLAATGQVLVDRHRSLLHDGVRLVATPHENKVVAAREPSVAIFIVEGYTEQGRGFAGGPRRFHGNGRGLRVSWTL